MNLLAHSPSVPPVQEVQHFRLCALHGVTWSMPQRLSQKLGLELESTQKHMGINRCNGVAQQITQRDCIAKLY